MGCITLLGGRRLLSRRYRYEVGVKTLVVSTTGAKRHDGFRSGRLGDDSEFCDKDRGGRGREDSIYRRKLPVPGRASN